MDDEGEEGDGFRSSTATNTRRRIVTKTPLEENKSDETTVAVTTQESLDGIREKANEDCKLRSDGDRQQIRQMVQGIGEGQDHELVRALVGQITREGDTVVASDSESKLWRDLSLKRTRSIWVIQKQEHWWRRLRRVTGKIRELVKKIQTNESKVG